MKTYVHIKTYILLFIANSLVIVKNLSTTTMSPKRWMVKLWYSHTMEYYSSIKRNASNNLDGFQRWYAEWEMPVSRGQITYYLSVQFSCSVMSNSLRPYEPQYTRPPCPSPTPRVYSNLSPLGWWCYPIISSSVVPFSSCLQSCPASGSFQMSQLFASGGQNIRVSASTSVRPMNIQDWSPLGWTGWISLQSKGLSWVFSNTIVQKHQFFSAQLSL